MSTYRHTAAVIATDGGMLARLVDPGAYELLGVAENAVLGERLISAAQPDVVVIENDLVGQQGLEALQFLAMAAPRAEFVLIVADEWIEIDREHCEIYAVIPRSALADLPDVMARLSRSFAGVGDSSRDRLDRRAGADRRRDQDWSKIGWEKRSGKDRRVAELQVG